MNPFELLGIDEGADEREIKRAYARWLKTTRPDDDPQGFQHLNNAYNKCLDLRNEVFSKSLLQENSEILIEKKNHEAYPAIHEYAENLLDKFPQQRKPQEYFDSSTTVTQIEFKRSFDDESFIHQIHLFASINKARDTYNWLMSLPELFSIEQKHDFPPRLLTGLTQKCALPPSRLRAIFLFFDIEQVSHPFPDLNQTISWLRQRSDHAFPNWDMPTKKGKRRTFHDYVRLIIFVIAGLLGIALLLDAMRST